eukprot:894598-Amorphochlora_amoeboformis.AAC.3
MVHHARKRDSTLSHAFFYGSQRIPPGPLKGTEVHPKRLHQPCFEAIQSFFELSVEENCPGRYHLPCNISFPLISGRIYDTRLITLGQYAHHPVGHCTPAPDRRTCPGMRFLGQLCTFIIERNPQTCRKLDTDAERGLSISGYGYVRRSLPSPPRPRSSLEGGDEEGIPVDFFLNLG